MKQYLASSKFINWHHPEILDLAKKLAQDSNNEKEIAKKCFEYVRDEIKHSWDYQLNPVTCIASDVLKYKTGFCYAKSHLLAALLRANNIPAALCYQRITITDTPPFCLHGLNAMFLKDLGWYKVDARGNKDSVNAQFTPPNEQLAFEIKLSGETHLPELFSEPMPSVIKVLSQFKNIKDVYLNLPDMELK